MRPTEHFYTNKATHDMSQESHKNSRINNWNAPVSSINHLCPEICRVDRCVSEYEVKNLPELTNFAKMQICQYPHAGALLALYTAQCLIPA